MRACIEHWGTHRLDGWAFEDLKRAGVGECCHRYFSRSSPHRLLALMTCERPRQPRTA